MRERLGFWDRLNRRERLIRVRRCRRLGHDWLTVTPFRQDCRRCYHVHCAFHGHHIGWPSLSQATPE